MGLVRPVPGAPAGVAAVEVDVIADGAVTRRHDMVTVEEPLEIRVLVGPADSREQMSVAVTMRTPGDDASLATGFLHGEGVIGGSSDVLAVSEAMNVVTVELAPSVAFDADRLRRHVYTTSSCGVCGKASIDAVLVTIPDIAGRDRFKVGAAALGALPGQLRESQAEFARTGGLHASGAFAPGGRIVAVAEDVGRHNALDKLVGRFLMDGALPLRGLGLVFSGRASFELVQKAAVAGCPFVAAIGPPSSLAVELAAEQRITLVGFLREGRFNVYTMPHRVLTGA